MLALARVAVRGGVRGMRLLSVHAKASPSSSTHPLTDKEVDLFHRDGWVAKSDFFTEEERRDVVNWTNEVQAWPETAGKWMQYFEKVNGKRLLCRTENFLEYHEGLNKLILGRLKDAVDQLFGEASTLYKEKINFKLPGGNGFLPHQDGPAWVSGGMTYHISAAVLADDATIENGCLELVRGAHKSGFVEHIGGGIPESLSTDWTWEPLIARAGDVVFFDSCVPHRSGPNVSKTSRRTYYITYGLAREGDHRADYFADKREQFPPDIERIPGKDYSKGGEVFNLGNPISTKLED